MQALAGTDSSVSPYPGPVPAGWLPLAGLWGPVPASCRALGRFVRVFGRAASGADCGAILSVVILCRNVANKVRTAACTPYILCLSL